jgi:UDP-N-acetylglucosamine 4,6-dehydratase/5-epimerase
MKYLITGITGTLGQAVSKILLEEGHHVVGVSRDEQKQRVLPTHKNLSLHLGDIRDIDRMSEVAWDVNAIFHFAALKCVDTLEHQPIEAIHTNVLGTKNILDVQRMLGIDRVVLSSTDKAAYPINAYGCTKALAEKLVLQNRRNVVCRYGNVLASRGSVIPSFIKSIKEEGTAYLTDEWMTRFFIRIEDAAQFVIDQSRSLSGGLKIPEMKGTNLIVLARAIAEILGLDQIQLKVFGMRPGEKINECLKMAHEGQEIHSNTATQFTREELISLLEPIVKACA